MSVQLLQYMNKVKDKELVLQFLKCRPFSNHNNTPSPINPPHNQPEPQTKLNSG